MLRYLIIRDKVTENQVGKTCSPFFLSLFFPLQNTGQFILLNCTTLYFGLTSYRHTSQIKCKPIFSPVVLFLQTGIWTELYKIEDTFMKPLRVGLNMSRAHYERELNNTKENRKSKVKGQTPLK